MFGTHRTPRFVVLVSDLVCILPECHEQLRDSPFVEDVIRSDIQCLSDIVRHIRIKVQVCEYAFLYIIYFTVFIVGASDDF